MLHGRALRGFGCAREVKTYPRSGSGGRTGLQSHAARITPERTHEGTTVGQADVREVQDHPAPRPGPRDLLEQAPQAASGVARKWHVSPGSTSPSTSASRSV